MGFREFITNFRYRRRLEADLERYQNIAPPRNPSRRYIDKLVKRLLDQNKAWAARRELEMIGALAVPSLVEALQDTRFHQAEWKEYSPVPAPLNASLELLVAHAGDDVVKIASPLASSPDAEVRKAAGSHLASTGRASVLPLLEKLMQDDDAYVRSYVCMGIEQAIDEDRAEESFRQSAYGILLPHLAVDWGVPPNEAAATLIKLDPERAAVDLADPRWLSKSNPNLAGLIDACNKAHIMLPEMTLGDLLSQSLPKASEKRCFPDDYIAAAVVKAMALRGCSETSTLANSLLDHPNDQIQQAAGDALVTLAGIADPVQTVLDLLHKGDYAALSNEQKVVYCAFVFDAEVYNGGLMQFFGNSSGDRAVDTLAALSELGHAEAHSALSTAIRLIGPISREPDRDLRLTGFEGRWDELQPAFAPLESAYYATQAKLRQAWLLYAIRHAEHFRKS